MNKTISILVTGKVQGVWYRKYTQLKAQELHLSGSVKNLPDGSVFILVTGTDKQLESFTNWCWLGSPKSKVVNVVIQPLDLREFSAFLIE